MGAPGEAVQRARSREAAAGRARDAFLRAAAALTEYRSGGSGVGCVAFALLEASLGLIWLAEADDDEQSARSILERQVRASLSQRVRI
jgi:hypothetical protein